MEFSSNTLRHFPIGPTTVPTVHHPNTKVLLNVVGQEAQIQTFSMSSKKCPVFPVLTLQRQAQNIHAVTRKLITLMLLILRSVFFILSFSDFVYTFCFFLLKCVQTGLKNMYFKVVHQKYTGVISGLENY